MKSFVMAHKILGYVFIAVIFAATISLVYYHDVRKLSEESVDLPVHRERNINSFSSCVDAGFGVMKSLPAQCQTDDGLTFVDYEACIQIITTAKNPETQEEREFPTPCDVPKGWEKVTQ